MKQPKLVNAEKSCLSIFFSKLFIFKFYIKNYSFQIQLMLSFTHQAKGTVNKWIANQPSFQPIIITNKLPK